MVGAVTAREHSPLWQRLTWWVVIALTVLLFLWQLQSLFVLPQPNAFRWFGDETWLMSEARTQTTTGVVRYPLAVGSTLEHAKGVVLSMTWLSALLYGLPSAIFASDPVAVGRVVTAALAALLLLTLYRASRSFGTSPVLAACGTLLLLSSRSFLFASHSCRTDLLAGLITLAVVWYVISRDADKPRSRAWWYLFGAALAFLAVSSSIHLVTLLGPLTIYALYRLRAFRSASWLFATAGAAVTVALLAGIYLLTTRDNSLFASSGSHIQFHDVLRSIPILRPFSRSVQVANAVIRAKEFWKESPFLTLLPITIVIAVLRNVTLRLPLLAATAIVFLSYFFLGGAEINYLIQITPLLTLALVAILSRIPTHGVPIVIALCAFVGCAVGWRDARVGNRVGAQIAEGNHLAAERIVQAILSDWHGTAKPRVMSETPALDALTLYRSMRVMTDHFISFPVRDEPLDSALVRDTVNYAVLYNSPAYPKVRAAVDPLYQDIQHRGTLLLSATGIISDVSRDYFREPDFVDTLLLYRLQ